MTTTAFDLLLDPIHAWGVDVVFGLPGDGINGIIEGLRKREDKIRFLQVPMRNPQRSWHAHTPSTRANRAAVWRFPVRVVSIC